MIPVIIPAFKPDENLITLIKQLKNKGVNNIIVVADGAQEKYSHIFNRVRKVPGCFLLIHAVNLGKGRALKTAFDYALKKIPTAVGVVTADADGQHHPDDILKIIASLQANPHSLILGVRKFDKKVPFKSKAGNAITKHVMSFLLGKKISDTQTGLRGIPIELLSNFMLIKGERYEYETAVLIEVSKEKIAIIEEDIQTIYINNNKTSGFNPLLDSMKIYFLLLRFSSSGLLSAMVDYGLFALILYLFDNLFFASYGARAVALGVNFYLNKNFVFYDKEKNIRVLLKYIMLCVAMVTLSYLFIRFIITYHVMPPAIAKLFLETVLFFVNMQIQRKFIFNNSVKPIKK